MQPIVIAGAGIGGLSAALALARKGFSAEVFERATEIREVGAGIQLGPNAFRIFSEWDLEGSMEEIAFAPHAIQFRDSASGTEIFRQELGKSFLRRFGHPYRVAYRADVQKVLLEALTDYSSVKLHTGDGVRRFTEDAESLRVSTDRDKLVPAAALVAADGLWSEVRQAIVADGKPLEHGHVAYRAVLPCASLGTGLATDDVQIWIGPGHHVVCYKLRRGELFNVVAIIESSRNAEGWDNAPDLAELETSFANACPPLRELLPLLRNSRLWVLRDREPVKSWSRGATTLLGDAAHPALPYLAQGACMAIEDARCLAEHFARHAPNFATACDAYERDRIGRTARVQNSAREMGRLNHLSGEAARARDAALASRDPEDHEGNAWIFDVADASQSSAPASFFGPAP